MGRPFASQKYNSGSWWRRRRPWVKETLIPIAKSLPILSDGRRGNRRVAIAWVAGKRKRAADCDIMASCFKPVMIALLRHLISGKRRRRIIGHRTRMRTAGQR
jgi:hypothetical protein